MFNRLFNHLVGATLRPHAAVPALLVSCAVLGSMALMSPAPSAVGCPSGYDAVAPEEIAHERMPRLPENLLRAIGKHYGEQGCLRGHAPEALTEITEAQDARVEGLGVEIPGAHRRAVEQKAKLAKLQVTVPGAAGHWSDYGNGPMINDRTYRPSAGEDGIARAAGRVDDFAYDPLSKRLFAAVGNGGIWVTEAIGGDVATLATKESPWRFISQTLPSLVTSAVAWTVAGGGRVIALTGEHSQGGNSYVGLGAYWSSDLGQTWNHAVGIPDGAQAFRLAVDLSNPKIIYAATGKGLFRSTDAGENFVNVKLPTSDECAGVETPGHCGIANIVTDVVIRQPGGYAQASLETITCDSAGCAVLAAVGYRAGDLKYADGTAQSPGNGLYKSDTGAADSFTKLSIAGDGLSPQGFATQLRTGRIELGVAEGVTQDHNVVYALVSDAVLFRNGVPFVDIPRDDAAPPASAETCLELGDPDSLEYLVCSIYLGGYSPSVFNGLYVSIDFGGSWTRLADDNEISYNATTGSALVGAAALGISPGYQAWYDLWVRPDPTQADPVLGHPTRVLFGIEEIWKNRVNGVPVTGAQQTPNDFKVIGSYFAGDTCLFLVGTIGPPAPVCPVREGLVNGTTSHPDQQGGFFVPDDKGGVWLFAGNDGGVWKQYSADPITDDFANNKWGDSANDGFYTLLHYGIGVAKDGTVYFGNQDNASGKIDGATGKQSRIYIGDGVYAAVDPDNSNIAYYETPGLSLNKTNDGGITHSSVEPPYAVVGAKHFLAPFRMDPKDATHFVAAGTKVGESFDGGGVWTQVFDLGADEATGFPHQTRSLALDVDGANVYAGWCGPCNVLDGVAPVTRQFQRGLATNVGGADGWHQASAKGLPKRYIYNVEIGADDPKTVFVALGGYSTARWLVPGQYEDTNADAGSGHVYKSTDAGESFVDISGNLPDTVVTYLLQRGTQLLAGTDIGAFISSDLSGTTWAPLGDLPGVAVSELVMDPANPNRLFAATFGRGVQVYSFDGKAALLPTPTAPERGRFGGAMPLGMLVLMLAAVGMRRTSYRRKPVSSPKGG